MAKFRTQTDMPDIPKLDYFGALCEVWSGLSYAAYHLAYVRVYSQTAAFQTNRDQLWKEDQTTRETAQVDLIICRTHLATFFWQLDHVFEALAAAFARGQEEHPEFFRGWKEQLEEIRQMPIGKEIHCYRNKGHQIPGIIGTAWDGKDGKFLHHFLPSISGHEPKDSIEMNAQLQKYFEFVANVWLTSLPDYFKDKFPRSFRFPVTIPHGYLGELPPGLSGVPQLEVVINACDREVRT